jgi:hypothetical protein
MPFVRYPGLAGKVYVPERASADAKKHPCRDCFSCQMCSDGRCRSCLGQNQGTKHYCRLSAKSAHEVPQD